MGMHKGCRRSKCTSGAVSDALESYYRSSFVHASGGSFIFYESLNTVWRDFHGIYTARTAEIIASCNFQCDSRTDDSIPLQFESRSNLAAIGITRLVQLLNECICTTTATLTTASLYIQYVWRKIMFYNVKETFMRYLYEKKWEYAGTCVQLYYYY